VRLAPVSAGRLNLSVMAGAYMVLGVSLLWQPRRWQSTPAYHVLLDVLPAQAWGGLFLATGVLMGTAAWQFDRRRWLVVTALTPAIALTAGWMLAFIARYLSSPDTTPETWVSWAVFGFLLLRSASALDRPREVRRREIPEVGAFRQAVSDALYAAERDRKATTVAALEAEAGRLRAAVSAACAAYAEALLAVTPAGAMPSGGDLAGQAIDEARNALLRAEEAYERATGEKPAPPEPQ
jgi:hypothetical protein